MSELEPPRKNRFGEFFDPDLLEESPSCGYRQVRWIMVGFARGEYE